MWGPICHIFRQKWTEYERRWRILLRWSSKIIAQKPSCISRPDTSSIWLRIVALVMSYHIVISLGELTLSILYFIRPGTILMCRGELEDVHGIIHGPQPCVAKLKSYSITPVWRKWRKEEFSNVQHKQHAVVNELRILMELRDGLQTAGWRGHCGRSTVLTMLSNFLEG